MMNEQPVSSETVLRIWEQRHATVSRELVLMTAYSTQLQTHCVELELKLQAMSEKIEELKEQLAQPDLLEAAAIEARDTIRAG